MAKRRISASRKRGVDVMVAKTELDPLLREYSKLEVAKVSGLSAETLDKIDHVKVARVDASTVWALRNARALRDPPEAKEFSEGVVGTHGRMRGR